MQGNAGQAIYQRLSVARVPDGLIDEAIELTLDGISNSSDRDDIAARLADDEHRAVLRKEVVDVVILTTGAMEAPSEDVYHELIEVVAPEPFDDATAQLKAALMRRMGEAALDEIDVVQRANVLARLREGLSACGDRRAFELAALAA